MLGDRGVRVRCKVLRVKVRVRVEVSVRVRKPSVPSPGFMAGHGDVHPGWVRGKSEG